MKTQLSNLEVGDSFWIESWEGPIHLIVEDKMDGQIITNKGLMSPEQVVFTTKEEAIVEIFPKLVRQKDILFNRLLQTRREIDTITVIINNLKKWMN